MGGDGVLVEWGTGLAHPAENREEINEGIAIGGAAYNKVFEPNHPVYNGCGFPSLAAPGECIRKTVCSAFLK